MSGERNANLIVEHFGNLVNSDGGFSLPKMWLLKKTIFPKVGTDVPSAMLDKTNNLITNKASLVKLYKETMKKGCLPNL